MSAQILIFCGLICIGQMALSASVPKAPSSSRGLFAADLFREIAKTKINENVIISPISIQSAMAMAYMGAEGETATELVKGLRLPSNNKDVVGREFSETLKEKKGDAQLSIANKIYVNSGYRLRSTYNDLLRKYFNSEAESINFSQSADAVKTINNWIGKATNDKITDIMQPGSVDGDTSALIVNAIYFKGKWQVPFSKDSTRNRPFWVSNTKSVETETMFEEDDFKFGQFPELDATAIEMSYKDSDLSMLIILPNERDGLAKLEEKLCAVALNELSSRMTLENVLVFLPKFKIEFSTSVTEPLKSMGIQSIFGNSANLSGIFETGPPVKVSDVQHKAFIDVNEAGSEAAAATILKIVPMSFNFNTKNFFVDHPFVYAIKSADTVYFVGHVANPQ